MRSLKSYVARETFKHLPRSAPLIHVWTGLAQYGCAISAAFSNDLPTRLHHLYRDPRGLLKGVPTVAHPVCPHTR